MLKSSRFFHWLHGHKCRISDEKITQIAQKHLGNLFSDIPPKRIKQIQAVVSLIAEVNQLNTLEAIREYHEWLSSQIDGQ